MAYRPYPSTARARRQLQRHMPAAVTPAALSESVRLLRGLAAALQPVVISGMEMTVEALRAVRTAHPLVLAAPSDPAS